MLMVTSMCGYGRASRSVAEDRGLSGQQNLRMVHELQSLYGRYLDFEILIHNIICICSSAFSPTFLTAMRRGVEKGMPVVSTL